MFSLHERTQRRVCRTAFVAFCALPTIVVFGWVAYFHRPWSERDWQRSIEHTLHVGAQVENLSAPRPLMRKISKLALTDLETKLPLADANELIFHSVEQAEVRHVTIHAPQFVDIAKALQIWLAGNDFVAIHWQAEQVTLVGPAQQRFQLEDVIVKSQSTTAGTRQVVVKCSSGPQLVIERGASGATHCRLESAQTKLPTWLLADTMPGAGCWSTANFNGNLQLQKGRDSFVGSFKGEIDGIDCQEWIGSEKLQAEANLRMEEFTWQSERVETMQGSLQTTEGLISVELLNSLQRVLFCQVTDKAILESTDAVRFDKLACRFRLNSAGLTCVELTTLNNPQASGPGVLITADGKPLVMQPAYSNLPVPNLIQLFFPVERDVISGTREATEMGDKLPLPEIKRK
jgi:hypothetical protein